MSGDEYRIYGSFVQSVCIIIWHLVWALHRGGWKDNGASLSWMLDENKNNATTSKEGEKICAKYRGIPLSMWQSNSCSEASWKNASIDGQ